MLELPEEIKVDAPVELDRMEYRFITDRLKGIVFHRIDEDGKYWVKAVNGKACKYIMQVLEQSRKQRPRET